MTGTRGAAVSPTDEFAGLLASFARRLDALEVGAAGQRLPSVKVKRSTTTSPANNVTATIPWDIKPFDSHNFHAYAAGYERFTIPAGYGGRYLVGYSIAVAGSSVGSASAWMLRNGAGTLFAPAHSPNNTAGIRLTSTDLIDLAAGDYVAVSVAQSSGGPLAFGDVNDMLWMVRLGGSL